MTHIKGTLEEVAGIDELASTVRDLNKLRASVNDIGEFTTLQQVLVYHQEIECPYVIVGCYFNCH